jgi:hypothetical protein
MKFWKKLKIEIFTKIRIFLSKNSLKLNWNLKKMKNLNFENENYENF